MLCEVLILELRNCTLFHLSLRIFIVMPASILLRPGGAHLNGTLETAEREKSNAGEEVVRRISALKFYVL